MGKNSNSIIRKIWETNDSHLPLVVKDSSWRFINDFQEFQSCKGVFVFATSSHHIKYVGHSNNNCIKDAIADSIAQNNDEGSALVKVLYTSADKDASLIANVLKEKYLPVNNFKKSDKVKAKYN